MPAFAWFQGWKGHVAIALIALLLLVAPRLITAAPLDMLDSEQANGRFVDPAEESGQNFPGSAFFYAEGAFDPVPGVDTVQSEHVLGLEAVKAAPAAIFRGMSALDSYRALNCLTSAIYYEAANEPDEGQRAVAQVVLNRVRSPLWPNSVCGVVYQGSERTDFHCQFTFSCDGSMARMPVAAAWARARRVAQDALNGQVYAPVGLATHYHTLAVRPLWSSSLQAVAVIGAHIFYRNPGFNGTAAAFSDMYLGRETISGPARTSWPAKPVQPVEMLGAPYMPPASALPAPSAAPTPGWSAPAAPAAPQDDLPESTIRPEYRNSGRPLI
ncbi:Cell Wall Hydrolase [Sphingobium sp. AP50]|uniref:cell wall hydrolase n=1 Tax=Sphingobium sp. AP50 TaxID=1884369 RepID=UPI0008C380D2|nr:cell wall hydrolase [Sphingobium sp. AP50]SEI75542.1 Cell Wall Hydrolase [Sphingobium sp. AP50]